MRPTIAKLVRPIPEELLETKRGGRETFTYASHSTVVQILLRDVGPYDFEIVEIIRGTAPEIKRKNKPPFPSRENAILAVVARLRVDIDGRPTTIEEAGSCDAPAMKSDGDALKEALSDALKRCAMRLGVGLHLWAGAQFFLDPGAPTEADTTPIGNEGATRLHAILGKLGIDRAAHYDEASRVLERPVDTLSDLTATEANAVYLSAKNRADAGVAA